MVMCSVYGCGHRTGRDGGLVKFHCFPAITKYTKTDQKALVLCRRSLWLLRVCRQDLDDAKVTKQGARVCSYHFISGAPAALEDTSNPDWAPSLHLGHDFFDGKRKLQKKKKKFISKCQCDSYVACTKYRRNYKKNLKKKIINNDASSINKDVEISEDNEFKRCMSSSESGTSDDSESNSDFENYSLITMKPGNSEDAYNAFMKSEDSASADIVDFRTTESEIMTESSEVLSTTVKSDDNFSDDDNIKSVENNLHEISDEFSQRIISRSEPKKMNASRIMNCVTHATAFSAAETLLRYIMNQDEVNDADVNFILNLAQRIKERLN